MVGACITRMMPRGCCSRTSRKLEEKKKEHVKDKTVSFVDKDARYGAKSNEKTFTGYKTNIMKSDDGFVTDIIVTPGNTHYGSAENSFQMSARGITIVAPLKLYR